jgi:hypothetical protein
MYAHHELTPYLFVSFRTQLYVAHKEPSEIVFVLELMHGSCAWDAQFKAQTLRIACAMGFTALCEEMTASALQCLEDVHNVDAELFWEIMLCSRSNLLPSDIYERYDTSASCIATQASLPDANSTRVLRSSPVHMQ